MVGFLCKNIRKVTEIKMVSIAIRIDKWFNGREAGLKCVCVCVCVCVQINKENWAYNKGIADN